MPSINEPVKIGKHNCGGTIFLGGKEGKTGLWCDGCNDYPVKPRDKDGNPTIDRSEEKARWMKIKEKENGRAS